MSTSSPGTFRLGATVDPESHDRRDEPLLYESGDLTTHGVIVGMTGSGKTGLAIDLLEEVLADGIPTLVLDPSGDMGNLLLTFSQLRPEDFRPWIDERVAEQKGQTPDEFAAAQAQLWTEGLAGWDLGSADITALREGAHSTIYTPGSEAGVPLDLIGSLSAPPTVTPRIATTASRAACPASSPSWASRPTRCRAPNTSSWPT